MKEDIKKCSSKKHENLDAVFYCQNCNIYLCNKCQITHSDWFENHNIFDLNKDKEDVFTGYCQEKSHSHILEYFCKTHNKLCCAACISKIKNETNGQHSDCDVCVIEQIKEEKRNNLEYNIKELEELFQGLDKTLISLEEISKGINEDKENLKKEVQKIFTAIRNELNKREDKILLEIDEKFGEKFLKEDFIKESKKLPNKVKNSLEKGKIIEKEKKWEKSNDNLVLMINECINIENNISKIEKIKSEIEAFNLNKDKLKFFPIFEDKTDVNNDNESEEKISLEKREKDEEKKDKIINITNDDKKAKEKEIIKITFLGDQSVGKSSIIKKFSENKFDWDYQRTIGLDFQLKDINLKENFMSLHFYDTAGQEKFRSLIPMYLRDTQIMILTYDITNKESFTHIVDDWINFISDYIREDKIIVLVGNKKDLEGKRQISTKEAEDFAKQKGFLFHEVSSKTGEGINELFYNLIFQEIEKKILIKNIKDDILKNEKEEKISIILEKKDSDKKIIQIDEKKDIYKFDERENDSDLNNFIKLIQYFGYLDYNKHNNKDYKILMLGLDNSGKTVILYQYKMEETVKTMPTIGFNVETIYYNDLNLTIWDVGGNIRYLWKHYYNGTAGIIFVVDSNDKDRIEESAEELQKLLAEEQLINCPLLILANKQDLNDALPPGEIVEKIGIADSKGRDWLVQGSCGTTGQGLKEGLDWLISKLKK